MLALLVEKPLLGNTTGNRANNFNFNFKKKNKIKYPSHSQSSCPIDSWNAAQQNLSLQSWWSFISSWKTLGGHQGIWMIQQQSPDVNLLLDVLEESMVGEPTGLHRNCWPTVYLFFLTEIAFKIWSLSNYFEVYNTVLLTIITMLCIRSPKLIHLQTANLYTFINISPFPPPPNPW